MTHWTRLALCLPLAACTIYDNPVGTWWGEEVYAVSADFQVQSHLSFDDQDFRVSGSMFKPSEDDTVILCFDYAGTYDFAYTNVTTSGSTVQLPNLELVCLRDDDDPWRMTCGAEPSTQYPDFQDVVMVHEDTMDEPPTSLVSCQ